MQKSHFKAVAIHTIIWSMVFLFASAGICGQLTVSSENLLKKSHFEKPKIRAESPPRDAPREPPPQSYIIKLEGHSLTSFSSDPLMGATSLPRTKSGRPDLKSAASLDLLKRIQLRQKEFIASAKAALPDLLVAHRYDVIFNGISVVVNPSQAAKLNTLPGVVAVYADKLVKPQTDVSPHFIGADMLWGSPGTPGASGEGVVIGIIDTGVWPEHPSLRNPDPQGIPYPKPPAWWKGNACDFGSNVPGDLPFPCNDKLIGAVRIMDTYDLLIGTLPTEFLSARDDNGHGTHTGTTAGGNSGVLADLLGFPYNEVSGVAPRAHLAFYKCLGEQGGFTSDLLAGIQKAVADGVDVINYSVSGGEEPYSEATELAFLDAYAAGIFVAASAGNSGPESETVAHRGPWVTTVGASTTDRLFLSTITLMADNGDILSLTGSTITEGINTPTPIALPPAGQEQCTEPFAPGSMEGRIGLCAQGGGVGRAQKSWHLKQGGAAGMIFYNQKGLGTDNSHIPTVHLSTAAGEELLAFVNSHTGVTANFDRGEPTAVTGDVMANFSSRGGPGLPLEINKPDLTAPGVNIVAGNTPMPATTAGGVPRNFFQCIQGTSMSSPHVAGAAALLKALHPEWSPGQIKSALMTSAKADGILKEDGTTPADTFDAGSGRIDLSAADNPGVTFDVAAMDFRNYQANLRHVNYPSLFLPVMPEKLVLERTPMSVLPDARQWQLSVDAPPGLDIQVPASLFLESGQEKSFRIFFDAAQIPMGEVRHATLNMQSGAYSARMPITIVRGQPDVSLDVQCDPSQLNWGGTTAFTITVANASYENAEVHITDFLPWQLFMIPQSVQGADAYQNSIEYTGFLYAAKRPQVDANVLAGASPSGYLPLEPLGATQVTVSDDSITNFSVPAFTFAETTYDTIGIVSNGYIVLGGGTNADIDYINTNLPDTRAPNNILCPFWTDLNPEAGGQVLIALLTDSLKNWIVVEWYQVPNYNDGIPNTFQVWIAADGEEEVFFTYGPEISQGDAGNLTVGAEGVEGLTGTAVYYNGTGLLPAPSTEGYEVEAYSLPGIPGESHTITFDAIGWIPGEWTNFVRMTGSHLDGATTTYCSGKTVWRR